MQMQQLEVLGDASEVDKEGSKYPYVLQVRMTPEQKADLVARAKWSGRTLAEEMRQALRATQQAETTADERKGTSDAG
jgi:hypothetical protein